MPPLRTYAPAKPMKTERTHEENQERAYIAASRRSDRSLEARVESARRASEIHKRRTGRSLRVTEQDVINEEMYEEEDDDLPLPYRRLTAHLQTNSHDFNRKLAAYLTTNVAMRSALDHAINQSYAQQYPNAPQFAHTRPYSAGANGAVTFPSPLLTDGLAYSPAAVSSAHESTASPHSPHPFRQAPYPMPGTPGFRPAYQAHQRSASMTLPHGTSPPVVFSPGSARSSHSNTASPTENQHHSNSFRRMSMPASASSNSQVRPATTVPTTQRAATTTSVIASPVQIQHSQPIAQQNTMQEIKQEVQQPSSMGPPPPQPQPRSLSQSRSPPEPAKHISLPPHQNQQHQSPPPPPQHHPNQHQIPPAVQSFDYPQPFDISPFTMSLPQDSQMLLGSTLSPNDPFTAMLMSGNMHGLPFDTNSYGPPLSKQAQTNVGFYQSMDGMNSTLAPSAVAMPQQPSDTYAGSNAPAMTGSVSIGEYGYTTGSNDWMQPASNSTFSDAKVFEFVASQESSNGGSSTPSAPGTTANNDGVWDTYIDDKTWAAENAT